MSEKVLLCFESLIKNMDMFEYVYKKIWKFIAESQQKILTGLIWII